MKNMRSNLVKLFIYLNFLLLLSCHNSIENKIESASEASQILPKLFLENKIIFLSENHNIVNPIIFLSQNLEELYKSGLRYIVFEGKTPPKYLNERYYYFYPWSNVGWKLELKQLKESVELHNSKHKIFNQIKILYGEDGFEFPDTVNYDNIDVYFNERDKYIYDKIQEIVMNSNTSDKILLFYGDAHGSKKKWYNFSPDGISFFDWSPFSSYLNDYYSNNFISIDFRYINHNQNVGLDETNEKTKLLNSEEARNLSLTSDEYYYDYYMIDKYQHYGTNFQYDLNKDSIRRMIDTIKELSKNKEEILDSDYYYRASDRGQFFIILYYLKLFFGNNLDFTLWNCNNNLLFELNKLETKLNQENKPLKALLNFKPYDSKSIRSFHGLMSSAMPFPYNIKDKVYNEEFRKRMLQATEIIPEDIWPQYWVAYSYFVSEDYLNAKVYFDRILSNDLAYSIENLPQIVMMQIECCQKIGMLNEANMYEDILFNIHTQYQHLLGTCYDLELLREY